MKVGHLVSTNSKGQLVIPASVRKQLQIDEQVPLQLMVKGNTIQIVPILSVITSATTSESSYFDLLTQTKGSWANEKSPTAKRREIELAAAARRKAAW
jgi:bifunctional DNA-binding transcriptional regulator/antitoxin component of YhaV-PrlF toxin-antitoxin module